MAQKAGMPITLDTIAEIGPGDSIGSGIAALISGSSKYYALDIVKSVNIKKNLEVFDELIELFRSRQNIPDEAEFPEVKPLLGSYEFPRHILTDQRLEEVLRQDRLEKIRRSLLALDGSVTDKDDLSVYYIAPWNRVEAVEKETIDMIFSQAVLEHVDDLSTVYEAMYYWLKPAGFISHQIDFKSHDTADQWNGHWTHSEFIWMVIRGNRPYLLNREPHSTHIRLLRELNFEIVSDIEYRKRSVISREQLAPRFRHLSPDDLTTSGAFIQAAKKGNTRSS